MIEMSPQTDFAHSVCDCAQRLAENGIDALGALFDLTSQRLVRLALAVTRNQHDAEDAVQTALVRLARQPRLLSEVNSPWAYLLRIVRNEALLVGRRRQRCVAAGNLTDLATIRRVDELEQAETHRAVWAALRTLPTEQAEVVVLKIWESLTFAQIAAILETSPNTVASRYQYGMAKLTRLLEPVRQEVSHA
jgi:RNA polymerase sigma-70 factor (ECF subfamily)